MTEAALYYATQCKVFAHEEYRSGNFRQAELLPRDVRRARVTAIKIHAIQHRHRNRRDEEIIGAKMRPTEESQPNRATGAPGPGEEAHEETQPENGNGNGFRKASASFARMVNHGRKGPLIARHFIQRGENPTCRRRTTGRGFIDGSVWL